MKTYTTPTIIVRLRGREELLENAESVIASMRCNKYRHKDFPVTVDGDSVSWSLTQEETAKMCGTVGIELTIKNNDGTVVKTKTVNASIEHAIRECEI